MGEDPDRELVVELLAADGGVSIEQLRRMLRLRQAEISSSIAEQEDRLWRRAYADVAHALYWPFAMPNEQLPAAETWMLTSLEGLGIGAQMDTWPSLRGGHGRVGARGQSSGA